MRHPHTHSLYAYWNNLRSGRIAPFRSEIDPRSIAPLLESTFILEYLGHENIRYRLAGTKLCENFGMELRGMSALALWHGDNRFKMAESFRKIIASPCVAVVCCEIEASNKQTVEAEYLYLPLRSDFGDVSRILGCGTYVNSKFLGVKPSHASHHAIKHITYIDIQVDVVDNIPRHKDTYVPSLSGPSAGSFGISPDRLKRSVGSPPLFHAIEGGNEPSQTAIRNRNHLRLVQ